MELAGGKVLDYAGGLRVMGMLACTRAIGDHDLQEYGVIPEPEVMKLERSADDSWLILASDGLWDMLSNEVTGKGGAWLVELSGLFRLDCMCSVIWAGQAVTAKQTPYARLQEGWNEPFALMHVKSLRCHFVLSGQNA